MANSKNQAGHHPWTPEANQLPDPSDAPRAEYPTGQYRHDFEREGRYGQSQPRSGIAPAGTSLGGTEIPDASEEWVEAEGDFAGGSELDRVEATFAENSGYGTDSGLVRDQGASVRRTYDERNAPLAGHQTSVGAFGARAEPPRSDRRPLGNANDTPTLQAPFLGSSRGPAMYQGQGGETGWAGAAEGAEHAHGIYGEPYAPQTQGYHARGDHRTDGSIYEEICELLTQRHDVDPRRIEVRVAGGEVTLAGLVEKRIDKRVVEDIALSVSGVHDVHNRLTVDTTYTPGGARDRAGHSNS